MSSIPSGGSAAARSRWRWVRLLRVVSAVVFFAGLLLAFVGTGSAVRTVGHWLAAVQLVPSALRALGGGLAAAGLLGVLTLTLLFGRVYCSVVCPLGVLQDFAARLAPLLRRRPQLRRFTPAVPVVRHLVFGLALAGIAAGSGGLILMLLDPYSVFGRFAADLVRPVTGLVLHFSDRASGSATYLAPPHRDGVATAAVIVAAGLMPALAVVLAWRRGRLFCNTVCPVGTLLGLMSLRAPLRLQLNRNACTRCAACLRGCKSECIDVRQGAIDATRCVGCFNCLAACEQGAIGFGTRSRAERPGAVPAVFASSVTVSTPDPGRRQFLRQSACVAGLTVLGGRWTARADSGTAPETLVSAEPPPPVTPPGSRTLARFLSRCTGCQLCVAQCPTRVLKPAFMDYGLTGLRKPHLDFRHSHCRPDCTVCSEVCPEDAIAPLTVAEKHQTQIGVAQLTASKCRFCMLCVKRCPTGAVTAVENDGHPSVPLVDPERCIGCGLCEAVCPDYAAAIKVHGLPAHRRVSFAFAEPPSSPAS
jgi:ferredoxin